MVGDTAGLKRAGSQEAGYNGLNLNYFDSLLSIIRTH